MIQRLTTLFFALIFTASSFADEQRLKIKFESNNGRYDAQYKKGQWFLTNKSGSVKYKIQDHGFSSMTMFVSDNGQNVVVIDDFMEGHTIGDSKVLWIYHKGVLSQSYKLTDLLSDTCYVSMSIWHINWCIENFGFTNNQKSFSISTFEMTDYTFDLTTGKIIVNKKPDGFDSETLIVFGKFRKGKGEEVTMQIEKYIAGRVQPENKITFTTKYFGAGFWQEVLMIKGGKDVTPEKYRGQLFF